MLNDRMMLNYEVAWTRGLAARNWGHIFFTEKQLKMKV